jgi:hypothetical protein
MFGTLRSMLNPSPRPVVPVGLPTEVERQMAAIARIGGLNLRDRAAFNNALGIAFVGVRLGIDFTRDPYAPAKFMACMELLGALNGTGIDPTDPAILDMMAEALRGVSC